MKLFLWPGRYTIHRLKPGLPLPTGMEQAPFYSIVSAPGEVTVICPEDIPYDASKLPPGAYTAAQGRRIFQVEGPLALDMTGVLGRIGTSLGAYGVSIFAVSTYDTDYILIEEPSVPRAVVALETEGYTIERWGQIQPA